MKKLLILIVILSTTVISLSSFADNKATQVVPQAFMDLYYDFTGSSNPGYPKGKVNISQQVYQATMADKSTQKAIDGPLILLIDSSIYVYDNQGKRLVYHLMRTNPDSGFYQMTAISHVGPALAYLAYIKQNGGSDWKSGLQSLLKSLRQVKKVNADTTNPWIDKVNVPAWQPHKQQIVNLVDYASSMAGNYIVDVLNNDKDFTPNSLQRDFLDGNSDYPIPYNDVMVGTFMLTGYQSMTELHDILAKVDIDLSKAKVLIRFVAGSNITAGVSKGSNWLVPFVIALSNNKLNQDRIFIAPYLAVKPSLQQDKLSTEDFTYYNYAWIRNYNRSRVANAVFTSIPTIYIPGRPAIPGDYNYSKSADINDFLMRLKFSLSNSTEYLSNTVAFWLAGELAAKKWDLSKVELPGFNAGLPKSMDKYPANSPAIKSVKQS